MRQWIFRINYEKRRHRYAHFVTLTYDSKYIPISPTGWPSLSPTVAKKKHPNSRYFDWPFEMCNHYPNFMKRLRFNLKKRYGVTQKIRYFAVGEYGDIGKRPHYHAIIFGVPEPQLFQVSWNDERTPLGDVQVGDVEGPSIQYTCKYMMKPTKVPFFPGDDRVKEKQWASKGIGENYLTPQRIAWHRADLSRQYCMIDGYRVPLPEYYKNRIYTDHEKMIIRDNARKYRQEKDLEKFEKVSKLYGPEYYDDYLIGEKHRRDTEIHQPKNKNDGKSI